MRGREDRSPEGLCLSTGGAIELCKTATISRRLFEGHLKHLGAERMRRWGARKRQGLVRVTVWADPLWLADMLYQVGELDSADTDDTPSLEAAHQRLSMPHDHFRASDGALIEQYCQAIALARQAYANLSEEGSVIAGQS